MTQYTQYHIHLLNEFKEQVEQQAPFVQDDQLTSSDEELINGLNQLCQMAQQTEANNEQGQWLVNRLVSAYPHLMHLLPRDILWFFGGDCLHYMPDEEIAFYQQLDELRFTAQESGNPIDYTAAKESLLKAQ